MNQKVGVDKEATAKRQVMIAQAAANAKDGFLDNYLDVEIANLLQEFIAIDCKNSQAIFAIKYRLDALMLVKSGIDNLASSVEFYQQEYQKIKTGK